MQFRLSVPLKVLESEVVLPVALADVRRTDAPTPPLPQRREMECALHKNLVPWVHEVLVQMPLVRVVSVGDKIVLHYSLGGGGCLNSVL